MKDQGIELSSDELRISCSPACLQPGSTVTVIWRPRCGCR